MSLKSGLQSISGSAGRAAARRVNRGSTPDRCVLNEDDDGSSSSEAEGSQDSDNQDAGLVLTAGLDDGYDDEQDEFTPGPIRGGSVDYDGTAYSSVATVVSPSATKSAKTPATAVKTRPRESKYDASKAAATKVSS